MIGITCPDCCRSGTPDDPGPQAAGEDPAHDATGGFAIPGDDRSPLAGWHLHGVEGLGAALAAQFALAGRPEIADPVRFPIRRYRITAPADLDGDDGHLAGPAGSAVGQGQSSHAAGVQPHGERIGQPPGQSGRFHIRHGDLLSGAGTCRTARSPRAGCSPSRLRCACLLDSTQGRRSHGRTSADGTQSYLLRARSYSRLRPAGPRPRHPRDPNNRYLKPVLGCLRRNRRGVFAAAVTRYLKPVYAAEPADIEDFARRQILGA